MTDTELRLIAAAATIGPGSQPNSRYITPAGIGMPAALQANAKTGSGGTRPLPASALKILQKQLSIKRLY
jgi:hypothetical protein